MFAILVHLRSRHEPEKTEKVEIHDISIADYVRMSIERKISEVGKALTEAGKPLTDYEVEYIE